MEPRGSGELLARIRFERRGPAENVGGVVVDGKWTRLGRRAAKLDPTRGGEAIIAGRLQGMSAFDCWVRSDDLTRSVTTEDRVVDELTGEALAVRFARDMTRRRRWILMQLEAGVADGEEAPGAGPA